MSKPIKDMLDDGQALREALHLQALEGNPLDAEQQALFDRTRREGWSDEECRAHLKARALRRAGLPAAE